MIIDGKEYKFNIPAYAISFDDVAKVNKQLKNVFKAYAGQYNHIYVDYIQSIFKSFYNMDVKDKNNKSDNILTDEEIRNALNKEKRLKNLSVSEVKQFIKVLVKVNNDKINQIKRDSNRIATDLYNQISGPSGNVNTIEQLKRITPENAYYVLKMYEKQAKEPLVKALGEEWNFRTDAIKRFVLFPLVIRAKNLGIEVSTTFYQYENDKKKLNKMAETLLDVIEERLNNPNLVYYSNIKTTVTSSSEEQAKKKAEYQKKIAEEYKKKLERPLNNEKPKDIAKQLYNQIKGASINQKTIELLKKIGKNNAAQVIVEYKKLAKQSLADAIDEEWGLDINTVKNYLCTPLIEQIKNLKYRNTGNLEKDIKKITSMESLNTFIDMWSEKIDIRKDIPAKINPKGYTLIALKKKYPNKDCRQMGNEIIIKNNDGSTFMTIIKPTDEDIWIYDKYDKNNNSTRQAIYSNPDLNLSWYVLNGKYMGVENDCQTSKKIEHTYKVNELFLDICRKIGGIIPIPGTRNSLKDNIKNIDRNNILQILALYKQKAGETLFDAIRGESGLLNDTRTAFIEHLKTQLDYAVENFISDKDILREISFFKEQTGISLYETIKNSEIAQDKKQKILNKISKTVSKIAKTTPENVAEKLKEYRYSGISITEFISPEYSGLPKRLCDICMQRIEANLTAYINNMDFERLGDNLDDTSDLINIPILNLIIVNERGLSPERKVQYLRQIENKFMNYIDKKTEKDDIKRYLEIEFNKILKNPDNIDVSLINKLYSKLNTRNNWVKIGELHELKPANGKIDNVSYQGGTGDCWLLAAINAIARSKKGLELLNNSLKVNSDGSVTVHLNGVNKSYTISKRDLYGAKELSSGDLDVRAIEIAIERYMMEYRNGDINGNFSSVAFEILLGGKKKVWDWSNTGKKFDNSYKNRINNPNILVSAAISHYENEEGSVKAVSGETIHADHAYTVVRADDNYVYLIDPWNSGKLLKLKYKDFTDVFDQICEVEIP